MLTMTSAQKIGALLAENNGYLKTADVVALGISRTALGGYVRANGLERVAHGLYVSGDAWTDGMFVIQTRYPEAVFSHESALFLLNLAGREPSPYSVTLASGTNTAQLSKQGIKVYKVSAARFGLGIINGRSPSGQPVRTYNAERTICDLFRSRRNIEIQDLRDAVRSYIGLKEKNIPLLMRYAMVFRVDKPIRQYLEALL